MRSSRVNIAHMTLQRMRLKNPTGAIGNGRFPELRITCRQVAAVSLEKSQIAETATIGYEAYFPVDCVTTITPLMGCFGLYGDGNAMV